MKKLGLLMLLFLSCVLLYGCEKNLAYSNLERDNYNTGGNLTFVYDETTRTALFGGEGEIIQFYHKDIAKGWAEDGCRVGVKILIPKGIDDYKSGSAVINGEKVSGEDFYLQNEDGFSNYAVFQPIVSEELKHVVLKITWEEGYEEQVYYIVIKEETIFMEE